MAKGFFLVGASAAAALLLGAALPDAGPADFDGEIAELREQVAQLSAAIEAARAEIASRPTREELEHLQRQLEQAGGTNASAYFDRAVELGIAERFELAKTGLTPEAERRAAAAVVREAEAAGLDPLLVAAVIEVESTFRNYAVSPVGAVGLMQVMPATGAWFGEKIGVPATGRKELFDPERNIRLGAHYLADLQRKFGRTDLALLAYNAGPTRARTILNKGSDAELERWLDAYARKVISAQRRMQSRLAER